MREMIRQFLHMLFPDVQLFRPRVTERRRAQSGRIPVSCVTADIVQEPRQTRALVRAGKRNGQRVAVGPDRRPLWEVRGWRRKGRQMVGAFRTPRGSIAGFITVDRAGRPREYYLINPPESLLNGPKEACFRPRRNGTYWVHFSHPPQELDGGIVAIETLIRDALAT